MPVDRIGSIVYLLEAGNVERCHTTPHHGSYTVASHSWRMLTLLFKLHPSPGVDLIKAVQFHDVGERVYGDVPAYCNDHGELEQHIRRKVFVDVSLDKEDQQWLYCLDKLELFLWCRDQIAMGNRNVEPILEEMKTLLSRTLFEETMPGDVIHYWITLCPWYRFRVGDL